MVYQQHRNKHLKHGCAALPLQQYDDGTQQCECGAYWEVVKQVSEKEVKSTGIQSDHPLQREGEPIHKFDVANRQGDDLWESVRAWNHKENNKGVGLFKIQRGGEKNQPPLQPFHQEDTQALLELIHQEQRCMMERHHYS